MTESSLSIRPRVYLDTSVISAYFDVRTVERMTVTREFWGQSERYSLATSTLALAELSAAPDSSLRRQFDEIGGGVPS